MMYASSKDALRRAMDGTAADIQGMDFSGVAYDSVLERGGRKAGFYWDCKFCQQSQPSIQHNE